MLTYITRCLFIVFGYVCQKILFAIVNYTLLVVHRCPKYTRLRNICLPLLHHGTSVHTVHKISLIQTILIARKSLASTITSK